MKIVKLLLSQASKEMREPFLPMKIPALLAHLSDVEFLYSGSKYYKLYEQMGHLIGLGGVCKTQRRVYPDGCDTPAEILPSTAVNAAHRCCTFASPIRYGLSLSARRPIAIREKASVWVPFCIPYID